MSIKQTMTPTPEEVQRTTRLRTIMAVNQLRPEDVAEILGVKTSTVYVYRCLTSGTMISDRDLRLIELELASRGAA